MSLRNVEPVTMAWILTNWLEKAKTFFEDAAFRCAESRVRDVLLPRLGYLQAQQLSSYNIVGSEALEPQPADDIIAESTFDHDIVALALEDAVRQGVLLSNPLGAVTIRHPVRCRGRLHPGSERAIRPQGAK
ncbi:hypothetical protein [Nocardia terpenica]|uniref:hypothetical protein n=1 Tax=Nocardia terpenica TaxID=455432 RepID=UPI0012E90E88|nr:hypothetical protein [Nocardia terpenica]NQE89324.1 hypothetical protein [Nocardia terpenica]